MQLHDVLRYDDELCDKVNQILNSRMAVIRDLVEGAKKEGEISAETDSTALAFIIMGFFREICLKWRLSGQEFSLSKITLSTLEMTLKAFQ